MKITHGEILKSLEDMVGFKMIVSYTIGEIKEDDTGTTVFLTIIPYAPIEKIIFKR